MAPAVNVPEDRVFVSRAPGVAAALLDAADRIGADRKWGIRTVAGGYHVFPQIAEEYLRATGATLEADGVDSDADDSAPDGEGVGSVETEDAGAESVETEDDDDADGQTEAVVGGSDTEGPQTEGSEAVPDETWDWRAINSWAAKQDPPIQFPKGATVSEKLSIIHNNG